MKKHTQCPVCLSVKSQPLLSLKNFPIFQHPVPKETTIEGPYTVDLDYQLCEECGHGYQKEYNQRVLENLYSHHYYTPRPADVGVESTQAFVESLSKSIPQLKEFESILEVGCSCGEVLDVLSSLVPNAKIAALEPNTEARKVAGSKGYEMYSEFFGLAFTTDHNRQYDFIFSRHVIEHIFDFKDFLEATKRLSTENTILALETPCLDSALSSNNMTGFHVEHISYFSRRSLQILLAKHGWYLEKEDITRAGNLIMYFKQGERSQALATFPANSETFQYTIQSKRSALIEKIKGSNKKLVMWGAGAGGRIQMSFIETIPNAIVDSNPNKVSRYYAGLPSLNIEIVEEWVEAHKKEQDSWLMLISSMFVNEIKEKLTELQWKGEILVAS